MHAFLYISPQTPTNEVLKEILPIEVETFVHYTVSSIDEVRALKKDLRYAPKVLTAFVLIGVDEAKAEAQNALLKLLEEPPENTLLVLSVTNESALLSTILSRVQKLKKEIDHAMITEETEEIKNYFSYFSKTTDRADAIEAINKLLKVKKLNKDKLEQGYLAIEHLKKNTSVPLTLLHLSLNLAT